MATYSLAMFPRVIGLAPGPDIEKMRSWERTSKSRNNRLPASTPSPIPPSASVCLAAGSGVRCLEAPAITSPPLSPGCSRSPGEQAASTRAASKTTSVRTGLREGPPPALLGKVPAKARPLRNHLRHDFLGDVEVRVDFLHVVVLLQGVDQAQRLPRRSRVEVDAILGLHGDLRVLVRDLPLTESIPDGR